MNIIYDPKDFWILLFNFKLKHHKKKKNTIGVILKVKKTFTQKFERKVPRWRKEVMTPEIY